MNLFGPKCEIVESEPNIPGIVPATPSFKLNLTSVQINIGGITLVISGLLLNTGVIMLVIQSFSPDITEIMLYLE
ncbi:MAG: hypothetical protein M0R39_05530 [Prolixibacteraceae bacterium]|nr:hypothetical protein [Prolixibacteraceae bacterium]